MIDLLIFLLILFIIGAAAYWIITKFIPAGTPQMIALAVVGVVLLILLLNQLGVADSGILRR